MNAYEDRCEWILAIENSPYGIHAVMSSSLCVEDGSIDDTRAGVKRAQ